MSVSPKLVVPWFCEPFGVEKSTIETEGDGGPSEIVDFAEDATPVFSSTTALTREANLFRSSLVLFSDGGGHRVLGLYRLSPYLGMISYQRGAVQMLSPGVLIRRVVEGTDRSRIRENTGETVCQICPGAHKHCARREWKTNIAENLEKRQYKPSASTTTVEDDFRGMNGLVNAWGWLNEVQV